jgi:hypothetical protein
MRRVNERAKWLRGEWILPPASYASTELLPIRMAKHVSTKHLAEAVQFRNLDRNYWN